MTVYSVYDPHTKIIVGHIKSTSTPQSELQKVWPNIVCGHYEIDKYQVIDGQVMPVTCSIQSENEDLQLINRQVRNNFLLKIDQVNPIWYNSLTQQQQQELATYRQALLDIPQQAGFPESVEWPAKPEWL